MLKVTEKAATMIKGVPNSGQPVWEAVNVDEEENEPLNEDYKLYTRSAVIVDIKV